MCVCVCLQSVLPACKQGRTRVTLPPGHMGWAGQGRTAVACPAHQPNPQPDLPASIHGRGWITAKDCSSMCRRGSLG